MADDFHGVSLDWMQAQWRDCRDRDKQLSIFRDMTGAKKSEILRALGEETDEGLVTYRRWTQEEEAEIIRLAAEGNTIKQIAETIRRTRSSTEQHILWMRKRGTEVVLAGKQFPEKNKPAEAEQETNEMEEPKTSDTQMDLFEQAEERLIELLDEEEQLSDRLRTVNAELSRIRKKLSELLAMAGGGLVDE